MSITSITSITASCVIMPYHQVAPKEVLYPRSGLSSATARCLSFPPLPLLATAVKAGAEFPEPQDALRALEDMVCRRHPPVICPKPCTTYLRLIRLICEGTLRELL